MIKTRTQQIARAAYKRVAAHKNGSQAGAVPWKDYCALAHKFPSMILENGLAQATGFLLAKGGGEHRALFSDIHCVLRSVGATEAGDTRQLHEEIINTDLQGIMRLTRQTLDASGWLKRYAQGNPNTSDGDAGVAP